MQRNKKKAQNISQFYSLYLQWYDGSDMVPLKTKKPFWTLLVQQLQV